MTDVKLFSGTKSRYLAERIADYYGYGLGAIDLQTFSDGEMQPLINESVRGAYVFLIQSTFAPAENLLELLLMIDSAKRASAAYIAAVIPYFGYARQDRKHQPRVPISAKLVANILEAAGADRVVTLDFHTINSWTIFPGKVITSIFLRDWMSCPPALIPGESPVKCTGISTLTFTSS